MPPYPPLETTVQCLCGKVRLGVKSASSMRLVCFCKDCRGYYEHRREGNPSLPELEAGGGVDYTQVGPGDITVLSGQEHLRAARLRGPKGQPRVWAACCGTPLYSAGMSAMLYTFLVPEHKRGPVDFKIIGRDATGPVGEDVSKGVPWTWPFSMIGRLWGEKKTPVPFDAQTAEPEIVKL
ncbi:hypothetical protein DFJ74DRAFT_712206 [Hyaloraphidium curvatum]|nr:hypothetical protein DFJ74DRAFT_712206 [Hyaloraphidium curvatum]